MHALLLYLACHFCEMLLKQFLVDPHFKQFFCLICNLCSQSTLPRKVIIYGLQKALIIINNTIYDRITFAWAPSSNAGWGWNWGRGLATHYFEAMQTETCPFRATSKLQCCPAFALHAEPYFKKKQATQSGYVFMLVHYQPSLLLLFVVARAIQ